MHSIYSATIERKVLFLRTFITSWRGLNVHFIAKYAMLKVPYLSDMLLRRKIEGQFKLGKLEAFPRQLAIETVSDCNAKCIMCPSVSRTRQKGVMSLEVHSMIVDKVAECGAPISSITHAGLGEPLLDKTLVDKIKYEKRVFKKAQVIVYTNASLLDEKKGRELISAGLDVLSISLNAFTKETYETVMNLPYERTYNNILKFLELIKSTDSPVKVHVSLIPTEFHSEKEIKDFRHYWAGRVDAVIVPPLIGWGGFININKKSKWPCRYIWESLVIDWNAMVKMCCEDYDTQYPLGNLKTQSPMEIYNSLRMQKQRKDQMNGNFQWPVICQNCIETHNTAYEFWKTVLERN